MANNKGDTVELWGRSFKVVKKGLDEAEVTSFVSELIDERDQLLEQGKHFSALTKLAERTIVESDKLAEEIKEEAMNKAKIEADEIIAKAEQEAQQMIEEKRAEIIAAATEEAEAIKAGAEREAKALVENQKQKIQPELEAMTQQVYNELLSHLENLKQQATTLKEEVEQKLPQLIEEISQESKYNIQPIVLQDENNKLPAASGESLEGTEVSAESEELIQTIGEGDAGQLEEKASVSNDNQDANMYNGEVELGILPPINIMQIIAIMQYLDRLPEVESTELIPLYDKPSIITTLKEPLALLDILKTLPEVDVAEEDTDEGTTATDDAAGKKRRKIKIRLLEGKSVLDETKERLSDEVSSILSEGADASNE